jgi:hypothetical protein
MRLPSAPLGQTLGLTEDQFGLLPALRCRCHDLLMGSACRFQAKRTVPLQDTVTQGEVLQISGEI